MPPGLVPVKVICGAATSFCMTSDGGLVGWGLNDCGQIGCGYIGNGITEGLKKDTTRQRTPTCSPFFGNGTATIQETVHPITLMIRTLLHSHGKSLPRKKNRKKKTKEKKNSTSSSSDTSSSETPASDTSLLWSIVDVCCGDRHCGALTEDGSVVTWGCEARGRLGLGVRTHSSSSSSSGGSSSGYVLEPSVVNVNDGLCIVSLSCGRSHMLCVTDHKEVFSWGDNHSLQLGLGGGERSESGSSSSSSSSTSTSKSKSKSQGSSSANNQISRRRLKTPSLDAGRQQRQLVMKQQRTSRPDSSSSSTTTSFLTESDRIRYDSLHILSQQFYFTGLL